MSNIKHCVVFMSLSFISVFGSSPWMSKIFSIAKPLSPKSAAAKKAADAKAKVEKEAQKKAEEESKRITAFNFKKVDEATAEYQKALEELRTQSANLRTNKEAFQNASFQITSQTDFLRMKRTQKVYNINRYDFYAATLLFREKAKVLGEALVALNSTEQRHVTLQRELSDWREAVEQRYDEVYLKNNTENRD